MQKLDVDFATFRRVICEQVRLITGCVCIKEEPNQSDAPRPDLPYFGYKITSPGVPMGDANFQDSNGGQDFSYGTQMKMSVSFHCYALDQDEAYNKMMLFQMALNTNPIQESFRRKGLAIWDWGTVADLSALLNTGYQGRTQFDVQFGYAANLISTVGTIDTIDITGHADQNEIDLEIIKP